MNGGWWSTNGTTSTFTLGTLRQAPASRPHGHITMPVRWQGSTLAVCDGSALSALFAEGALAPAPAPAAPGNAVTVSLLSSGPVPFGTVAVNCRLRRIL